MEKLVLVFDLSGKYDESTNTQYLCTEYSYKEEFIADFTNALSAELIKYNKDYIIYCEWCKKCPTFKNRYLQEVKREDIDCDFENWRKELSDEDVKSIVVRRLSFNGIDFALSRLIDKFDGHYGVEDHVFIPALPQIFTLNEWFTQNEFGVF